MNTEVNENPIRRQMIESCGNVWLNTEYYDIDPCVLPPQLSGHFSAQVVARARQVALNPKEKKSYVLMEFPFAPYKGQCKRSCNEVP